MIVQTVGVKQRRTRKSSGRREGSAEREAPGRERGQQRRGYRREGPSERRDVLITSIDVHLQWIDVWSVLHHAQGSSGRNIPCVATPHVLSRGEGWARIETRTESRTARQDWLCYGLTVRVDRTYRYMHFSIYAGLRRFPAPFLIPRVPFRTVRCLKSKVSSYYAVSWHHACERGQDSAHRSRCRKRNCCYGLRSFLWIYEKLIQIWCNGISRN